MSTIGTMLKQPRVFAHDAIALGDLPDTLVGEIATITPLTPLPAGTGYSGAIDMTMTGGSGCGAEFSAIVIGGVIQSFGVFTSGGRNYQIGDVLTATQLGGGASNDVQVTVATVSVPTAWALGDPITPMMECPTISYWQDKSSYTYSTSIPSGPFQTPGPGASLYVGVDMDITVINEATTEVEYIGVTAGSFLPVSVLTVVDQSAGDLDDILALF